MSSNNTIKISAAGSGKTWGICSNALAIVRDPLYTKRILITTYTNKGVEAIQTEIRKQNYGVLHDKIVVKSWYQFLLSDCIRPYQTFIAGINEIISFDFSKTYGYINKKPHGDKKRYIINGYVLSNVASELVVVINERSNGLVVDRLEKIYSHIFIDEVQDFVGDDLSIIDLFFDSHIDTTCVGDNKQATYKTHNTRKYKNQSGANVWEHFNYYVKNNLATIEDNLVSRRFNRDICSFANLIFSNKNNITTSMNDTTIHDGVYLICESDVMKYYENYQPVVLKHDIRTPTKNLFSLNFGQCKGCTFDRVLIFPNEPLRQFILKGTALKTEYKYYVAVTRARFSIAIVLKKLPDSLENFTPVMLNIDNDCIPALKFLLPEKNF